MADEGCSIVEDLDGNSRATNVDESFQDQVLAMLGDLCSDMQSMGKRVSQLEQERTQSVPARTPKGKGKALAKAAESANDNSNTVDPVATGETSNRSATSTSKNWADRDNKTMDYTTELIWDDDEDDPPKTKGVKLFKVVEKTKKFISHTFSVATPNNTRHQCRDKYGPNTTVSAYPNLDKVIKGKLSAATKS